MFHRSKLTAALLAAFESGRGVVDRVLLLLLKLIRRYSDVYSTSRWFRVFTQ